MKSAYVADLTADQTITSFFLVWEKEIRSGTTGKPYLRLSLGDRTGVVEARMWENFEEPAARLGRDDIVKVQARVEVYRGRNQLIIDKIRRAESNEVELDDFFPRTKEDVEMLYSELRQQVAAVRNPWLEKLLTAVVDDPEIIPRLKRAPAAKTMHHAYLGGLLEHVVSLCKLCRSVAAHYPEVDVDLLVAGAVLHDIGKLDEITYERSFAYSTEGQLLGHIVMEVELVGKKMDAMAGFPEELKTLVKHLLISHHGKPEFGSPKVPMFREAVLFNFLDDLDSKMNAMANSLAGEGGEGDWTAWNSALERRLLRTGKYLGGESAAADKAREKPTQLRFHTAGGDSGKDG
jgi:3'-5' exoribonuclease